MDGAVCFIPSTGTCAGDVQSSHSQDTTSWPVRPSVRLFHILVHRRAASSVAERPPLVPILSSPCILLQGYCNGIRGVVDPKRGQSPYIGQTPEQARSELLERGILYTQLAFLERAKKGDLFAVELFRDAGMDLHAPMDDHGRTALMRAAKEGRRLGAEFLVEHGADIHAQEYPRWHLPEGALARLGKGSIRARDRTIAYSPDGTRLAVATTLGIWLYDVHIPNEVTYAWNLESAAGYFWSRWIYEIPTYNEVLFLLGWGVSSVSFSPDGNTLASGGEEILLWDMSPYLAPSAPIPTQTALLANFPNPFNPDTYIPYQLHAPASVRLTIYDIRGGLVRVIDVGDRAAGQYLTCTRAAHWDGRDQRGQHVASGVYLYRLQAGLVAHVRKMLLVK